MLNEYDPCVKNILDNGTQDEIDELYRRADLVRSEELEDDRLYME